MSKHPTLGGQAIIAQDTVLVQLVPLVDRLPTPPPPPRRRGRPTVYSDGLFLKAPTIMIVRRIHRVGELLAVLEEPTEEMRALRELLAENGRFPSRRTFERRLRALPEALPERIGVLGRHLVGRLKPWVKTGHQLALLHRHRRKACTNRGLKAFLRAA